VPALRDRAFLVSSWANSLWSTPVDHPHSQRCGSAYSVGEFALSRIQPSVKSSADLISTNRAWWMSCCRYIKPSRFRGFGHKQRFCAIRVSQLFASTNPPDLLAPSEHSKNPRFCLVLMTIPRPTQAAEQGAPGAQRHFPRRAIACPNPAISSKWSPPRRTSKAEGQSAVGRSAWTTKVRY
jgi:hypothetical protein